jgi:hypothetical protein
VDEQSSLISFGSPVDDLLDFFVKAIDVRVLEHGWHLGRVFRLGQPVTSDPRQVEVVTAEVVADEPVLLINEEGSLASAMTGDVAHG